MKNEIVITGLGVVSPLGHSSQEMFKNLIAGQSGVASIERFDTSNFNVRFAGEIKNFDASAYFDAKELKRTSRYIQYMVYAGQEAVKMAGLSDNIDKTRAGIIAGSGMGGLDCYYNNSVTLKERGSRRVSPFFIPQTISNMGAGTLAIQLGWKGGNWAVTSACATGNHSIMSAADQIRLGHADVMLCGGSEESVCPVAMAGFSSMKALSTRNDEPQKASRPFDKDRDGFVMGEGCGMLVLESRKHAESRGAKILGTLAGYGSSCDAYHMSAPLETGEGVALAVNKAIQDANLKPQDIEVINCHATSTPLGDVAEVSAMKKVFKEHVNNMKFMATKSLIGHSLGGASAIEAVVSVMTLSEGILHPTLNVENQDPRCDIDCIANQSKPTNAEYVVSNSFGFGGHNSSVIFGRGLPVS